MTNDRQPTDWTAEEFVAVFGHPEATPDQGTQIAWYQRRVKAMEELLVCYRVGRQPSERLLRELELTRTHIAPDGTWKAEPAADHHARLAAGTDDAVAVLSRLADAAPPDLLLLVVPGAQRQP